jgi:hypothetical protein
MVIFEPRRVNCIGLEYRLQPGCGGRKTPARKSASEGGIPNINAAYVSNNIAH